jgi:ubiquitin-protein ligase
MPKGIERDDLWILWIPGKKGTIWDGGHYPVEITFPADYPQIGPLIKF